MGPTGDASAPGRAPGRAPAIAACYRVVESPVGPLFCAASPQGLCAVEFLAGRRLARSLGDLARRFPHLALHEAGTARAAVADAICTEAAAQLRAYFAGQLRGFSLPLCMRGTPFQLRVWDALRRIPFGQTRAYGAIALEIGRAGAARAVGSACGANPVAIVVPCHRAVGSDGSLTGFGGGLAAKRLLLDLEGACPAPAEQTFLFG